MRRDFIKAATITHVSEKRLLAFYRAYVHVNDMRFDAVLTETYNPFCCNIFLIPFPSGFKCSLQLKFSKKMVYLGFTVATALKFCRTYHSLTKLGFVVLFILNNNSFNSSASSSTSQSL